MAGAAADLQWKDRYRELLRDFETKEREWTKLEAALRKAGARIAVAAMGQSEELDAALQPLVESLRTNGALPQLDTSATSVMRALKVHESATRASDGIDFRKLLVDLVRQLGRVPEFSDAAASLGDRLAAGISPPGMAGFLEDLASAVAELVASLREQRTELERFLAEVTRQLTLLEAWTTWQSDAETSRRGDATNFERAVETQMDGVLIAFDDGQDVAAIKSQVQSRLDAVAQQLKEFRASEERRSAEHERRSAELRQEVLHLKVRTSELTALCADQEKRLMIDPLTGVHSRYAYERRLAEEHDRWQRHGGALTFTIWDLDNFKGINDRLGHEAGDRLLRAICEILNRTKRESDFFARIGGEEFVLLLPATPLAAALGVAEKLRRTIEVASFQHKGRRELVTISCGLAEFRPGDTPSGVYERADRALYAAKQQGRNRCVSA